MSDTESTHSEVDKTGELTVAIILTVTSTVTNTAANGARKSTTKKETKTKEDHFTFAASQESYLDFLRQCLAKHKQDEKYKVLSEQQAFKFRYYFQPGRTYVIPHLLPTGSVLTQLIFRYIEKQMLSMLIAWRTMLIW